MEMILNTENSNEAVEQEKNKKSATDLNEETQKILQWRGIKTDYPNKSVAAIFEEQVIIYGDRVAVVQNKISVSYKELNIQANQLARHLQKLGVDSQQIIGVTLENGILAIVSFIAILKLGCAYLPIDPMFPVERIQFILKDSNVKYFLTKNERVCLNTTVKKVSLEDNKIIYYSPENLHLKTSSETLAYVIYTSGSTGQPKGVKILNKGIVRLVKNTNYIDINPDHIFSQLSSITFDAATFEIWGALLNGAMTVIIPKNILFSASKFLKLKNRHNINVMFITTALYNQLFITKPELFDNLDYLMVGGEVNSPFIMMQQLERVGCPKHFLSVYGPTENTTFSTYYPINNKNDIATSVPIGFPIANTFCYIVTSQGSLAKTGEIGELYLAGDGLAEGYTNQPELTKEKFINNFLDKETNFKLYRTGDLVRIFPDGVLDFVGRIDSQIKVRGFRVEPEELELTLKKLPYIKDVVVLATTHNSIKKMTAIVVLNDKNPRILKSEIIEDLKRKLPEYMLPSSLFFEKKFKLNCNGKIDKRSLEKKYKLNSIIIFMEEGI